MSNELYIATEYHYAKQLYGASDPCVFFYYWKSWIEPPEFEYSHEHTGTDKRIKRRQGETDYKLRKYCKLTTTDRDKMTRNQRKRFRKRVEKKYKESMK